MCAHERGREAIAGQARRGAWSGVARWAVVSAMAIALVSCGTAPPAPWGMAADALLPSPRLIVGRVVAVDTREGFAFVELAFDAPSAALVDGTELIARTLDLRETAKLRSSRFVRGRTLGTKIVGGQPALNDEVVWQAP